MTEVLLVGTRVVSGSTGATKHLDTAGGDTPQGIHYGASPQATLYEWSEFIDSADHEHYDYNSAITGGSTTKLVSQRLEAVRFYVPYDGNTAASATVTVNAAPVSPISLVIGNRSYAFKDGTAGDEYTGADGEIDVSSGTTAQIASRIRDAVMGTPSASGFGDGTPPHHAVSAFKASAGDSIINLQAYRVGRAGNSIALATSGAGTSNLTLSGSLFTGGGTAALTPGTSRWYVDGDWQTDGTKIGYYSPYPRRLIHWTFASPSDPGGAVQVELRDENSAIGLTLSVTTGNNPDGDPNWRGRYVVSGTGGGVVIPAGAYLQGFLPGTSVAPPAGSRFTLYLSREWA